MKIIVKNLDEVNPRKFRLKKLTGTLLGEDIGAVVEEPEGTWNWCLAAKPAAPLPIVPYSVLEADTNSGATINFTDYDFAVIDHNGIVSHYAWNDITQATAAQNVPLAPVTAAGTGAYNRGVLNVSADPITLKISALPSDQDQLINLRAWQDTLVYRASTNTWEATVQPFDESTITVTDWTVEEGTDSRGITGKLNSSVLPLGWFNVFGTVDDGSGADLTYSLVAVDQPTGEFGMTDNVPAEFEGERKFILRVVYALTLTEPHLHHVDLEHSYTVGDVCNCTSSSATFTIPNTIPQLNSPYLLDMDGNLIHLGTLEAPMDTVKNLLDWVFAGNAGTWSTNLEYTGVVTGDELVVTLTNKTTECNEFHLELNSESVLVFNMNGTLCAAVHS